MLLSCNPNNALIFANNIDIFYKASCSSIIQYKYSLLSITYVYEYTSTGSDTTTVTDYSHRLQSVTVVTLTNIFSLSSYFLTFSFFMFNDYSAGINFTNEENNEK